MQSQAERRYIAALEALAGAGFPDGTKIDRWAYVVAAAIPDEDETGDGGTTPPDVDGDLTADAYTAHGAEHARDGCPIRDGVAAARGLDTVNLIRVEGRAAMRDGAVMAAEARATGDVSESGHTLSFETLTLAAELIARRTSLDHVRRFLHGYVRRGFLAALR